MKKLKVTISNLMKMRNGEICGEQVSFRVLQAGRVLVERTVSGKTSSPFTLSYDVSAGEEPLVVEHDRPDMPHLRLSASFSLQEHVSYLGMALCKVIVDEEKGGASPSGCGLSALKNANDTLARHSSERGRPKGEVSPLKMGDTDIDALDKLSELFIEKLAHTKHFTFLK